MSEAKVWTPIPASLEYDLITAAIKGHEIPVEYRMCRLTPAPTPLPLEMPDSPGYFSFEGRLDGSSVEKLQWLVMVRRNSIDDSLYVYRFGGQTFKASQMFGTWTRVYMPWEQRPQPTTGGER